jgi:hypothetical protein
MGGWARELFAPGCFGPVWVSLLFPSVELGGALTCVACVRHFFEPALWVGSGDEWNWAGRGFLSADLVFGRSIGWAAVLEGVVGGIVGGDPAILWSHEYGGVVDDSYL